MVKYSLSTREVLRAEPKGSPEGGAQGISQGLRLYFTVYPESQYRHSHLTNNGPNLAVAYAEVTAVSGNVHIVVAIELITSVETVLAAMLTCSQSHIRSHNH